MNKINIDVQQHQFLDVDANLNWQLEVCRCIEWLEEQPDQVWVLFEPDCYWFSIILVALLASKKDIELPQNGQPEYLGWLSQQGGRFIDKAVITKFATARTPNNVTISLSQSATLFFYTSGSSGAPKRIEKKLRHLITEVQTLNSVFAFEGNPIVASTVSHQHIYGLLFKLLWPLLTGRSLLTQFFEYPEHLVKSAMQRDSKKVIIVASPAHLHRLADDNVFAAITSQISTIFSSGGPLKPEVNLTLKQSLGVDIVEVYGSSETGGVAWRNLQDLQNQCWRPFPNIDISVNAASNLIIDSPYLDEVAYKTDDMAKITAEGQFLLLGRSDRVVKIEEKRVSLDEIQAKLSAHDFVEQVYALVLSGKRNQLGVVLQLSEQGYQQLEITGKFAFSRQLKQYLSAWFEPVVLPKKFRYITEWPVNSQGKIVKSEMEALFE